MDSLKSTLAAKMPRLGRGLLLAAFFVSLPFLAKGQDRVSRDAPAERVDAQGGKFPIYDVPEIQPIGKGSSRGILTSRPQMPPTPIAAINVGDDIVTGPGQRRRLQLADGSILFVNQQTEAKLTDAGHLSLKTGEIYVESAPAKSLVVLTPHGELTGGGSHFSVRVDTTDTHILVARGSIQCKGALDRAIAGQRLSIGKQVVFRTAPTSLSQMLDWTRELMLAAESPLIPGSEHAGGALIAIDPKGQEAKLELRKFHIDVHIEDGFARTTIDQTYFNQEAEQLEGTFYFPLPADASLSRLAMYVGGVLREGGMAERDHARQTYESIRYYNRDPALLEWVDGTTFKMRVFPIEARQEKRLVLSYSQWLPNLNGEMQYRFPAGHSLQMVKDWSFRAFIKDGKDFAWSSPSHNLQIDKGLMATTEKGVAAEDMTMKDVEQLKEFAKDEGTLGDAAIRELDNVARLAKDAAVRQAAVMALKDVRQLSGKDLVLSATAKNVRTNQDVVLAISGKAGKAEEARFSTTAHDGAHYFMMRYRPDIDALPRMPGGKPEARNWLFLFEASGDRDPLLARVQIDVIRHFLHHAGPEDRFTILTANTRVRAWSKEFMPVDTENVLSALAFLEGAHLIGALDLGLAFAESAKYLKQADNPYLVHLGSGIAAMGERRHDELIKSLPASSRYVGIGVGRRWDRSFMKEAAQRTGGHFTQINPDEEIPWRAFELFAGLNMPRLHNVKVSADPDVSFRALTTSVSQGEEVCAIAKLPGEELPQKVLVSGMLNGKPWEKTVAVKNVTKKAEYLPRTWAKLEIDRLLAEDALKNKDTIIALSKAMYVMTPFTSLLVLENDDQHAQFKVDRGRKDHWAMYSCPEKIDIVYEPLDGMPDPKSAAGKMPLAKEVLKTVGGYEEQRRYVSHPAAKAGPDGFAPPPLATPPPPPDLVFGNQANVFAAAPSKPSSAAFPGYNFTQAAQQLGGNFADERAFRGAGQEFRIEAVPAPVTNLGLGRTTPRPPVLRAMPGINHFYLSQNTRGLPDPLGDEPLGARMTVAGAAGGAGFGGKVGGGGGRGAGGGDAAFGSISRGLNSTMTYRSQRLDDSDANPNLLYRRPTFRLPDSVFFDLTAYAPGMANSTADVEAILEAEARPSMSNKPGKIDPKALDLFTRARNFGWQAWTMPAEDGRPALTVTFDGTGKYAYERLLHTGMTITPTRSASEESSAGIREQVTCDGQTLLHLYPRLGIGAQRTVSRFHRADFADVVPWALPDAADLAHGADLKVVAERTVAIIPHQEAGLLKLAQAAESPEKWAGYWLDLARTAEGKGPVDPVWQYRDHFNPLARDGKPLEGKDLDKLLTELRDNLTWHRTHLVFGSDGKILERQLVKMPKGDIVSRRISSPDGVVKLLDAKGKEVAVIKGKLTSAKAPVGLGAKPQAADSSLVVLPLPYRTPEHVLKTMKAANTTVDSARFKEALPLFAAYVAAGNANEAHNVFRRVFHAREQRQFGFYVLLAGCGLNLDSQNGDVLAEHLENPVAQYLALHTSPVLRKHASQWAMNSDQWQEGFLQFLGQTHAILQRWESEKVLKGDPAKVAAEKRRALDYVKKHKNTAFAWVLLSYMQDRADKEPATQINMEFHLELGECWNLFVVKAASFDVEAGSFDYAARYERARSIYQAGKKKEARDAFHKLYETTLKKNQSTRHLTESGKAAEDQLQALIHDLVLLEEEHGKDHPQIKSLRKRIAFLRDQRAPSDRTDDAFPAELLPPIDEVFRRCLQVNRSDDPWSQLMNRTARLLIENEHRPAVLALARQVWSVEDEPLAQHLLTMALEGTGERRGVSPTWTPAEKERVGITLAVIDFLRERAQIAQADELLQKLLTDAKLAQRPELWRLAGTLADSRDMPARAIECLEKALDLEFRRQPAAYSSSSGQPPMAVDLQQVRRDYRKLLDHYQSLADAMVALNMRPPEGFLVKVVRCADRWRALDADSGDACRLAANILQRLHDTDLGWDYLTTPVGLHPNESGPWWELAGSLSRKGDLTLADRAYEAAFAAEPTNAQILWDRAQNLRQAGQEQAARRLYQQLADGTWQPRFQGIQTQAKLRLK